MASTAPSISDFFSAPPPTSQLYAPSEVQRLGDYDSNATVTSTSELEGSQSSEGIDWTRLHGYELPPPRTKKPKGNVSFVWTYGYRIYDPKKGIEYWLCRLCHQSPRKPRDSSEHRFVASLTSNAITHLKKHRIAKEGIYEDPQLPQGSQSSLDNHLHSLSRDFDPEVFKGLILELFTTEQLSLAKIESPIFRKLLCYLSPRCKASIPSRRSLSRYIAAAYDNTHAVVSSELAKARTKVNLSFDLWTSPGRRLSLLRVIAHYLDCVSNPRVILLALPRMVSSHTAVNLASQIGGLVDHFQLQQRISNMVTDNASENHACMNILAGQLGIDADHRHVLCMGHVINLVAHQVLFGTDVEAFEHELEVNVTAEAVELASWRKKGLIGRLHNLIRYITYSSKRQDAFLALQTATIDPLQDHPESQKKPLYLIRDNLTRWNSWYDAAVRALLLRNAINEFID